MLRLGEIAVQVVDRLNINSRVSGFYSESPHSEKHMLDISECKDVSSFVVKDLRVQTDASSSQVLLSFVANLLPFLVPLLIGDDSSSAEGTSAKPITLGLNNITLCLYEPLNDSSVPYPSQLNQSRSLVQGETASRSAKLDEEGMKFSVLTLKLSSELSWYFDVTGETRFKVDVGYIALHLRCKRTKSAAQSKSKERTVLYPTSFLLATLKGKDSKTSNITLGLKRTYVSTTAGHTTSLLCSSTASSPQ